VSGNPGGRPRKTPTIRDELEEELAQSTQFREGNDVFTVTKQRAVVKALVREALGGDLRAIASVVALARIEPAGESDTDDAADQAALESYVAEEVARHVRRGRRA
jgi:hypothetical protein